MPGYPSKIRMQCLKFFYFSFISPNDRTIFSFRTIAFSFLNKSQSSTKIATLYILELASSLNPELYKSSGFLRRKKKRSQFLPTLSLIKITLGIPLTCERTFANHESSFELRELNLPTLYLNRP